jgi:tetratricopeptide (TPR) repeat protein
MTSASTRKCILFLSCLYFTACHSQDSLYSKAITEADLSYQFKSWTKGDKKTDKPKYEMAKTLYQKALELKPDAVYPTTRIREINEILFSFDAIPLYQRLFKSGDSLFDVRNYSKAAIIYRQCDSVLSLMHPDRAERRKYSAWERMLLSEDYAAFTDREDSLNAFRSSIDKADKLYDDFLSGMAADRNEPQILSDAIAEYKKAQLLERGSKYIPFRLQLAAYLSEERTAD